MFLLPAGIVTNNKKINKLTSYFIYLFFCIPFFAKKKKKSDTANVNVKSV